MTSPQERVSDQLGEQQRLSIVTPIPDFRALESVPAYLGGMAHIRLEQLFGRPLASSDARPDEDIEIGRRSGVPMGDIFGREQVFRENLPKITTSVKQFAEDQSISETQAWHEVVDILQGSGIGRPMHRTLDRPLGGVYGALSHIEENREAGIVLIVRGNIQNWDGKRNSQARALLGALSPEARQKLKLVIHAGTGRQHEGANELWQPEVQSYLQTDGDNVTSSLTEARVAAEIRAPRTRQLLGSVGLAHVKVDAVILPEQDSGDNLMRAIIAAHGDVLRDSLIVEAGNPPAGYTQLMGGLILAKELGIDPRRQYVAMSEGVTIVLPDYYAALSEHERMEVQNGATAVNSFNGWLGAIVDVNRFMAVYPNS